MKTTKGGPPITDDDINEFEKKYKLSLPPPYREFLLRTNGGCPERDAFRIPGFHASPSSVQVFLGLKTEISSCRLDETREALSDRIPDHLLVIASTGLADEICISMAPETYGSVYYWDGVHISPTYGELFWVADSFDVFLEQLYRDEDSPKIELFNKT